MSELEVELAVWKQAHANALETADREAKALKGRLAALNGQVSSMETLMVDLPTSCLLALTGYQRTRAYLFFVSSTETRVCSPSRF